MNRCKACNEFKKDCEEFGHNFCLSCANFICNYIDLRDRFFIPEALKEIHSLIDFKKNNIFISKVKKQMRLTQLRLKRKLLELGFEALMKS